MPWQEQTFISEITKKTAEIELVSDLQIFAGELFKNYLLDLTPVPGFSFSEKQILFLTQKAVDEFAQQLRVQKKSGFEKSYAAAWKVVVEDFHRSHCWGLEAGIKKTLTPKKSPEKKKESVIPYIWTAIQALLVMKVVILYFGLQTEDVAHPNNKFYVFGAILFSMLSLFYFAWKNHRKNSENQNKEPE